MIECDKSVALLLELLERPSVTPDDAGCQAHIRDRLSRAGFACESMRFGAVDNLWARYGDEPPLLCFAGHTDVVPPGDPPAWTSDPFIPERRDGRIYARGAADMKAGLAAMVVAAEEFVAAHPDFAGSLALLVTSDEEGDAVDGTARVINRLSGRGETIDWCVVGEPSSKAHLGDMIRIGRRGSLSGKLRVRGKQGHVAYPEKLDNPIRRFAPVLAELHETTWDAGNEHFPATSFQVVHLQAGVGALNVSPPDLSVHFNFRFSTEWRHQALQDRFRRLLDAHDLDYELEWQLQGEPFLTGPGRLVDAVQSAVEELTGRAPALSTGGGTSDGRFIAPAGAEVIELGPVNDSIHQANEYVLESDVPALAALYRRIIERLLL